jgi:RimJ/RimL family protein N-acetyltransferase
VDKQEVVDALQFHSTTLTARLANGEDIGFMLGQEKIYEQFLGQWTEDEHLQAFKNPSLVQILVQDGDRTIGYLILQGLTSPTKSLELARISVTDPGRGYGKAIINSVKKLTFDTLGFHRLWLDVIDYNTRAFETYKQLGFVLEGTLRDADLYQGKYHDMHILSILENEYHS